MCRRSDLQNLLLLVISSLFLLAFAVGIVTVPAQAQQQLPTSVQAVATASPSPPTAGPAATVVQNKQRAQQGKTQGNATFWSWTALILILIGGAVLLAAVCGFLVWSRKRPDEYTTLREIAGRLLRRQAHPDWKWAAPGLGLLLLAALGGEVTLLSTAKIPVNDPRLRLAAAILGAVLLIIAEWRGWPRRVDITDHQRPSAFVPRPTELAQLRAALVDQNGRRPRRIALVGMGGAGKSVLAEEATRDPAIQKVYPDMAWVSLGRRPRLAEHQHRLAKQLGSNDAVINVDDGRDLLGKLLADRACLLIVDDVWMREDLRAFDVVGERLALLVTTRHGDVAKAFKVMATVEVNELDDGQALALLAGRAGQDVTSLPATARQVAQEVGNLALGLAMAGALATDIGWKNVLSLLQAAKLEAFDVPVWGNYRYESLQKAIQVSIDALEPDPRKRYLELAVFNGLGPVPVSAVEALWAPVEVNPQTPVEVIPAVTRSLLARFEHRSLLRRHPDGRVSRHNLQGDVAANLLGASGLAQAHTQLLTGYRARCKDGWASVVPDGYVFEHLATHLVAAGQRKELQSLLVDFDWLRAKLRATDINALLADYEVDKELVSDPTLRLVQAALRLSAHVLARDPTQLPGQLVGRLLTYQQPVIQALLAQARAWHDEPWLCPRLPSLTPPGGPLWRVLEGHTGPVWAVAVAERQVVSGSADGTLRVWDLASGRCQHILQGHTSGVRAVAVADGRVISGSEDQTVRVWDLASGQCQHVLPGHTSGVWAVAVAEGRVVSGSADRRLRVWDLATGQCQHILEGHTSGVWAVAVAEGRVVSGSADRTVRVWDLASGQCQYILHGHTNAVWAVAVAEGRVVSGSADRRLRVWDLASGQCQHILPGHTGRVWAVAVAGGRAVSGSEDQTVRVWDLASGRCQHILPGHTNAVWAVAVAEGRVISGSEDQTVRVWDLASGQRQRIPRGHTNAVRAVAVAEGRVISGSADGTLRVWDLASGQRQRIPRGHTNAVRAVAVAEGRVISGSADGTLRVWDLASGQCQRVLHGHTSGLRAVAVAEGRVISGSADGTLRVWDLASGQCQRVLHGHTGPVRAVAVADGLVISGSADHSLRVWDLASGQCQRVLHGHIGQVRAVAVADGLVISGSQDQTLRVWDLASGQCQRVLEGHIGQVRAVAVAEGLVISGSQDQTLRVWDLASGQCQRVLHGHTSGVWGATVAGGRAVSGSADRTLRVWNLESGQEVARWEGEAAFLAYDAIVTHMGTIDNRPSLVIAAGDAGGHVHCLQLLGDSGAAASEPK